MFSRWLFSTLFDILCVNTTQKVYNMKKNFIDFHLLIFVFFSPIPSQKIFVFVLKVLKNFLSLRKAKKYFWMIFSSYVFCCYLALLSYSEINEMKIRSFSLSYNNLQQEGSKFRGHKLSCVQNRRQAALPTVICQFTFSNLV